MKVIYLIGSLRNTEVPVVAAYLRTLNFEVFDDWYSAGPEADDYWQKYEKDRKRSYPEALQSWHAKDVFNFDKFHLDRCDIGVLVLPAGRSGHVELGYVAGQGKPCYILMPEEPDRYDVMYQFANGGVYFDRDKLGQALLDARPTYQQLVKRSIDQGWSSPSRLPEDSCWTGLQRLPEGCTGLRGETPQQGTEVSAGGPCGGQRLTNGWSSG